MGESENISGLELPSWLSMENGSVGDGTGVRTFGDGVGPNAGGHKADGAGMCQRQLTMLTSHENSDVG